MTTMHDFSSFPSSTRKKRVDLHCHSRASTEADEAMLQVLSCPESFSDPARIYAQARQRGMDFVTITDHDSISGVGEIHHLPDVLVGEEVTSYFPEDHCKMHILVWGITPSDHQIIQTFREDVYGLAEYIYESRIAHAVAHPLYRQNGMLKRWHVERLLLMFKGFECLNGAHALTHRAAFEPMIKRLSVNEIRRLQRVHNRKALWPMPWEKSRTGGSDDHSLLNIGRTWTEFPEHVNSCQDILDCIRECRCEPGGEAGSSIKLAHNFYGVGLQYYNRKISGGKGARSAMIRRLVGNTEPIGPIGRPVMTLGRAAIQAKNRIGEFLGFNKKAAGTQRLGQLFAESALQRLGESKEICDALQMGRAALAEHQPMFDLICRINRDVTSGIFADVAKSLANGKVGGIFDAVSATLAQQSLLMPYYFALFHQNQERHLLGELTGKKNVPERPSLRIGFFTDATDETSPAGQLVSELSQYSRLFDLQLTTFTCDAANWPPDAMGKDFVPLTKVAIPTTDVYLRIPPVLEILQAADCEQFDVILVNTCGPMALCGKLAAAMLRVPVVAVRHEDFSRQVLDATQGDYRLCAAAGAYSAWFYGSTKPASGTAAEIWDACLEALPTDEAKAVEFDPDIPETVGV
jgi:hypothetical protein